MRTMDGALVIDKPDGMSSHTVVVHIRRIVGTRRVGHTGTLDPFATGVLVTLIGKATRLMQFLNDAVKEYEAVIRLGYATDTGDRTGRRLKSVTQRAGDLHAAEIETAMASLRGEIEQVPPMYSAKKVRGRKLYELARRGEEIERQATRVRVDEFALLDHGDSGATADGTRDLRVRVVCSAGTYVRTLAEDLGQRLGVGAHLAELRRTRAGCFRIEDAHTLEELTELAQSNSLPEALLSPDETVAHLPFLDLDDNDLRRALNGLDIECQSHWEDRQPVRLRNRIGDLIAIGKFDRGRLLIHPDVVLGTD